MRKTVFFLFFLWSVLVLRAGNVDADMAKRIARQFFLSRNLPAETSSLRMLDTAPVTTRSAGDPAFYIINNTRGGFVIISGDTATEPVLAYATEGSFSLDHAPAAVTDVLAEYEKAVLRSREERRTPLPAVRARWQALASATPTRAETDAERAVVLLETALWSQDSPYNLLCPRVQGSRSLTGCVATAMSIILRYWKYPEKGRGSIPAYTYATGGRTIAVEGVTLGHTYLWDRMPTRTSDFRTDEQRNQVATLMRDCGHMVQMQYSPSSSGAYSEDVLPALKTYMDYDQNARFVYREFYSTEQWIDLLEKELQAGRPVYMSGTSERDGGGHAFVATGYDRQHYVYFNWGWAGANNGFFSMAPYGYAPEARNPEFFADQDAIIGLQPATGQPAEAHGEIWWNPDPGICLALGDGEDPRTGDRFHLYTKAVSWLDRQWETEPFAFYFGDGNDAPGSYGIIAAHVAADGSVKGWISEPVALSSAEELSCQLTEPVAEGDRIRLFFRASEDEDWQPVRCNGDLQNGEISLQEAVSNQTYSSVRISRDAEYVQEQKRYSRVLVIHTKPGVRAAIYGEDGTLFSDVGEIGRTPECLFYSPDYQTVTIVLTHLRRGRYRVVLDRALDPASFAFSF